jgi:hypothetical protein
MFVGRMGKNDDEKSDTARASSNIIDKLSGIKNGMVPRPWPWWNGGGGVMSSHSRAAAAAVEAAADRPTIKWWLAAAANTNKKKQKKKKGEYCWLMAG